jgi:orotate phosphoribosyltransferase
MYDASTLAELMRIIIERGMTIDTDVGYTFKLHDEYPEAPRSPIKFNLATPQMRAGGRLNGDDLHLMGQLLWKYAKRNDIPAHALAGVPKVGEGLARSLQYSLRSETGQYVPLIEVHKEPGLRTIAQVIPSQEYPKGLVLLIDDVLTLGHSALEAAQRLKQAGYIIKHFLAVLDYDLDGRDTMADEAGIEGRGIIHVRTLVDFGIEQRLISMHHAEAIRHFLADMRDYAATHRPRALVSS